MSYLVNGRLYSGSAPCFYCSKAVGLDEPRVQWTGTTHILLHLPCALRLAAGLLADLGTAELKPLAQVIEPGEGLAWLTERARLTRQGEKTDFDKN